MKKGSLFTFLFIALLVVLLGVMVVGVLVMFGKSLGVFFSSIELSPLEDNVLVEDSEGCSDSDGGIFFSNKGKASYKFKFLFFSIFSREVIDECDGNELSEYYCSTDGIVRGVFSCEGGCLDGACLG